MDLTGVLAWLTGSGGGAFLLISWAASWGLEGVTWWHNLKAQVKVIIILAFSGLLGAGAAALQANPDLVAAIEPYIRPLIYGVMAWLSTQTAHWVSQFLEARKQEAKAATVEAASSKVEAKAATAGAKAQVEQVEILAGATQEQAAGPGDRERGR